MSLTPFEMREVRSPGVPPMPWLSRFAETNLRTYVCGPDGRSGIFFFSLDAARLPAVLAARLSATAILGRGERADSHFLTARYQLYTLIGGRLVAVAVEHPPWPLHRGSLVQLQEDLLTVAGLPAPPSAPLLHTSPGVRVRIGTPRAVTATSAPHWAAPR